MAESVSAALDDGRFDALSLFCLQTTERIDVGSASGS
jgi:hypothetical protein